MFSPGCFVPVSHPSEKSSVNKRIMKNKLAMQPHKGLAIPPVTPLCFQPFVLSILSVAVSPATTSLQQHSWKIDTVETGWLARGLWSHLDQWVSFECSSISEGTRTREGGGNQITIALIKQTVIWNKSQNKRLHPCFPQGRVCASASTQSLCIT